MADECEFAHIKVTAKTAPDELIYAGSSQAREEAALQGGAPHVASSVPKVPSGEPSGMPQGAASGALSSAASGTASSVASGTASSAASGTASSAASGTASSAAQPASPAQAVSPANERATHRGERYRETTMADLQDTSISLTQKLVIIAAILLIIGAIVYYLVALR